jgi:hypothetical protein
MIPFTTPCCGLRDWRAPLERQDPRTPWSWLTLLVVAFLLGFLFGSTMPARAASSPLAGASLESLHAR